MISAVAFAAVRTTWRCTQVARAFELPWAVASVLVALWLLEAVLDELEADQLLNVVGDLSTSILAHWLDGGG